jgi:mRNA interferase MazF
MIAAITSSTDKAKMPTHIFIEANTSGLMKNSVVLLEQIRTIDKKRLCDYIGCLDNNAMKEVNKAIAVSFGIMEGK